jgi:murein L,D-transpeptidase YcbB/YkuD
MAPRCWRALGWAVAVALAALSLLPARASHVATAEIAAALEAALAAAATREADRGRRRSSDLGIVQAFYEHRGFAPAWTGDDAAEARGALLRGRFRTAGREGLEPAHYRARTPDADADAATPSRLAALELGLSLALLHYAVDVAVGRVEERGAEPSPAPARREARRATVLPAAAAAPDLAAWLDGLPPATDRYARLRGLLAELRAVAARGGWTRVPDSGVIRPAATSPAVAALRRRLVEAGDLAPELVVGDAYEAPVEAAARRFQARHGLDPDGVIGRATLAALNLPVERRIDQVIVNLERRRHLPPDLGRRYVFVNIADFELKLVETEADGRERTILTSPVVVGTQYNQTPILADEITYLVVNPYWHVPRSIATKELLPEIQKRRGYLGENDYTVWTADGHRVDPALVDWASLTRRHFPYTLRQEPGDDNALGRIKIMFPNELNVYLHDTPKKSLFGRTARAFSHGCIRVGRPFALAAELLRPQGIDQARLEARTAGPANQAIPLAAPVPIYVSYLTAFVDKDGTVHFRPDIYGRDAPLLARLRAE